MASYFDPSTLSSYDLSQHDTITQSVIFTNLVCMAVVVLVITLRIYIRHSIKHAAGLDDYFAAAAAASAIVLSTCCLFAATQGLGKHIWDLGLDNSPSSHNASLRISIPLFICYLSYLAANNFIKCSILASYYRLFPGQSVRRILLVLSGLVALNCISSILVGIFECYPVKSSWDWFSPRENCIDILRFFVISSWISTIIDIVIWGFPLPHFFKLQMKPRRKFHLVLLFGAGAFAFVAGILRLSRLDGLRSVDITYTGASPIDWSVAEVGTAIACASVPSLRPLAVRFFPCSWQSSSVSPLASTRPRAPTKFLGVAKDGHPYCGRDISLDDVESQQSTSLHSTTPDQALRQQKM
ncbi:hypothetical protein V8E51_014169 [Hyaloscypha variabilis]